MVAITRDDARIEVKRRWREIIPSITTPAQRKVNGETSWICPLCHHGEHGDGLTYNARSDAGGLKCFGCGYNGDIIDLYMQYTHADYNTALSELADMLNIAIDHEDTADHSSKPAREPQSARLQEQPQADYTEYYRQCRDRISYPDAVTYLNKRGISLKTAQDQGIGYDPMSDPANNPGGAGTSMYPARRLIIPVSQGYYIGRSIDQDTEPQYRKMIPKGSSADIYNAEIMYKSDARTVYVVEGAMDALSIIDCGYQAIALNSTSNVQILIDRLRREPVRATLIICLDNDDAGNAATGKLQDGLDNIGVSYICADISGCYKDPNERLTEDRSGLETALAAAEQAAKAAARPDNTELYISTMMQDEINRYCGGIKTGYKLLDKTTSGLYPGLYVIAAISSLGKTTWCHQLAEQLASNGTDTIYVSLEQSRLELVSKSLARRIALSNPLSRIDSLSIRSGYNRDAAMQAAKEYIADVGDRLSIVEGNMDSDIPYICDYVRRYIKRTNTRPVLIIDYLQIIRMPDGSDRRTVLDMAVTELKRLSRDQDITVIVISSVNRSGYLMPIDYESLKESGGIEYTADVVWGLQLQCLREPIFWGDKTADKRERVKQAKRESPRKIELTCLKNRFGAAGYNLYYNYYPAQELYLETEGDGNA